MTQYGFYFDSANCAGCKTCQVACKEYHQLPAKNLFRRVLNYAGGGWEKADSGNYVPKEIFGYFVSMACNHCASPACVANCATGAMVKDEETGIVHVDKDVCIGCGACVTACPYDAPSIDEQAGCAIKCDMCWDDLKIGRKPVCVAACPMRALDFGEYDELVGKYGKGNVQIEPLPMNVTDPCIVINPHARAQESGMGTGTLVSFESEL